MTCWHLYANSIHFRIPVIAWSSDWFIGLSASVVIGQNDYFWFGFTILNKKTALYFSFYKSKRGIQLLEEPVTGGVALLKQGKMTVSVGRNKQPFQDCLPILQQSTKMVLYIGEMGTATIAKVISNMLAATNTGAMGEAMMLGKRGGVNLMSPGFQLIIWISPLSFTARI